MDGPRRLQRPGIPDEQEIFLNFVSPMFEQVRIDAAPQIVVLAENRLGIGCPISSVRQAARQHGPHPCPRLPIAQRNQRHHDGPLADRAASGSRASREVSRRSGRIAPQSPELRQFHAAVELFYPGSRRGAAGPLEQVGDAAEPDDELVAVS